MLRKAGPAVLVAFFAILALVSPTAAAEPLGGASTFTTSKTTYRADPAKGLINVSITLNVTNQTPEFVRHLPVHRVRLRPVLRPDPLRLDLHAHDPLLPDRDERGPRVDRGRRQGDLERRRGEGAPGGVARRPAERLHGLDTDVPEDLQRPDPEDHPHVLDPRGRGAVGLAGPDERRLPQLRGVRPARRRIVGPDRRPVRVRDGDHRWPGRRLDLGRVEGPRQRADPRSLALLRPPHRDEPARVPSRVDRHGRGPPDRPGVVARRHGLARRRAEGGVLIDRSAREADRQPIPRDGGHHDPGGGGRDAGDAYAGVYDPGEHLARIPESYEQAGTVAHELSHAWFNGALFAPQWLSEGYAGWAERAVGANSEACTSPRLGVGSSSIALDDWKVASPRATQAEFDAIDAEYAASCGIVSEVADKIGLDGMRAVLGVLSTADGAYPGTRTRRSEHRTTGAPGSMRWTSRASIRPPRNPFTDVADLLVNYGAASEGDLAGRAEARNALGGSATPPASFGRSRSRSTSRCPPGTSRRRTRRSARCRGSWPMRTWWRRRWGSRKRTARCLPAWRRRQAWPTWRVPTKRPTPSSPLRRTSPPHSIVLMQTLVRSPRSACSGSTSSR